MREVVHVDSGRHAERCEARKGDPDSAAHHERYAADAEGSRRKTQTKSTTNLRRGTLAADQPSDKAPNHHLHDCCTEPEKGPRDPPL